MTRLRPSDMYLNKGKYMHELKDPEYCPSTYSHRHAWEMTGDVYHYNMVCECCGVIES